jgi:hypothetical protein
VLEIVACRVYERVHVQLETTLVGHAPRLGRRTEGGVCFGLRSDSATSVAEPLGPETARSRSHRQRHNWLQGTKVLGEMTALAPLHHLTRISEDGRIEIRRGGRLGPEVVRWLGCWVGWS